MYTNQYRKTFRAIKICDKEIEYNSNFKFILHTKMANPHYKPEIQAQTTLINFTVTRDGLEDQLLAEVVKVERPDLEETKVQSRYCRNGAKFLMLIRICYFRLTSPSSKMILK